MEGELALNILMLCYEFPPLGGGAGRVVEGLSGELVTKGHRVDVVTMAFETLPRKETLRGVRVRRLRCLRLREHYCTVGEAATFLVASARRMPELVDNGTYEITHAHFILPDGWSAWRISRSHGLPYVITAHGSDVPGYNPDRLWLAHRLLRPLWKRVALSASTVVSPSRSLESLIHSSCSRIRSEVIPHGFELPTSSPNGSRRGILVVSRLLQRKGVQHLIQALDGLVLDHPIHIVGDGPDLPTLRRMAAERGLPIEFHGWLENPSARLSALFESCAIFVLPSIRENFPVSLLEAMGNKMAVITTAGTGCAEVVGEAAVLVEPRAPAQLREALLSLSGDAERCRALGAQARDRVAAHFSWPAVASRYIEVYERALEAVRS